MPSYLGALSAGSGALELREIRYMAWLACKQMTETLRKSQACLARTWNTFSPKYLKNDYGKRPTIYCKI